MWTIGLFDWPLFTHHNAHPYGGFFLFFYFLVVVFILLRLDSQISDKEEQKRLSIYYTFYSAFCCLSVCMSQGVLLPEGFFRVLLLLPLIMLFFLNNTENNKRGLFLQDNSNPLYKNQWYTVTTSAALQVYLCKTLFFLLVTAAAAFDSLHIFHFMENLVPWMDAKPKPCRVTL